MKLFSLYILVLHEFGLGLAIGINSMVGIGCCCCCCAIKGMFCAQFCLKMRYKAHPKKKLRKKDLPIELGFCNVPLLRNNGCLYERTSTVDYIQSHTVNLCENIHISVVVRHSRTPQSYTHRETHTHTHAHAKIRQANTSTYFYTIIEALDYSDNNTEIHLYA